MTNLEFKPPAAGEGAADKQISVPAIDHAANIGAAAGDGHRPRAVRRRHGVTRLAHAADHGFRPFRVY